MPSIPGPHPHFNDRGVLKWCTSFADGLAAAKAERKKVFIEAAYVCRNQTCDAPVTEAEALRARCVA